MKSTILITAQYLENYGTPENPHWKTKGGQVFSLKVDGGDLMYGEEAVIKAIETLLAKESNDMCKFTYVGFERLTDDIIVLNETIFETALAEHLDNEQLVEKAEDINLKETAVIAW